MSKEVPDYCQVMEVRGNDGTVKQLLFPKALDLNRPKRPRTTFSNAQLKRLDMEFDRNPYLVGKDREKLAKDLGLTETQVKVWFQNKRTKLKNRSSDNEHVDKNVNNLTECNNNNEQPKSFTETMDKLPQIPNFQMFPMHQWLTQPNNNNQSFCSNLFF